MSVETTLTLTGMAEIQQTLAHLKAIDWKPVLNRFRAYYVKRIGEQITVSSQSKGGTGRGIFWRPAAPLYTRRDGTVIPAWGGVAKVRGQGSVKGRKSHGKRPTSGDTKLYGSAGISPGRLIKREISAGRMEISLSKMPGLEHTEGLRPFLRWQLPKDQMALNEMVTSHIRGQFAQAKKR